MIEMMIYHRLLFLFVVSCKQSVVIYLFIVNRHLHLLQPRLLSRQKFSFQTYIVVGKTALRTSVTKWNRFMAPVSGESFVYHCNKETTTTVR